MQHGTDLDALINAMDPGNISCCEIHEQRKEAVHAIGSDVKIMAGI